MGNRQRGDYFERQTRDALRAHGWLVIRSAGSLGIADLVALRDGKALLVSCKLAGRIDPVERLGLLEAANQSGARPLVAMRPHPGVVELRTVTRRPGYVVVDELRVPARKKRP